MTQREQRPPNRQPIPQITPGEKEYLQRLYLHDGAWTRAEAVARLGDARFKQLASEKLLGVQDTEMGPVYHLLSRGRLAAFGIGGAAYTLTRQLDDAYLRLSLKDLGWTLTSKASPFYKGFDQLFPSLNFKEAETSLGRVLLTGRLDGGGYTSEGIERLMRRVKSTALAYNLLFVILTPHPRRGQEKAQRHRSILHLIHHLPRVDSSNLTRFNPIKTPATPPDPGPILTAAGARQQRERGVIPDLTLEILQLSHKDRLERAQAALEVDRILSAAQLARYYGLSPSHLTGRLITRAIVRPGKNRGGLEVHQSIVAADRRAARLDDGNLNHRLTTAQIRLNLGVDANPERWIVESRNALRLDYPDAVHVTADGELWAIEADTGQYDLPTVMRKMQAFQDQNYAHVVWGTTSDVRVRNLTKKISQALGPDIRPDIRLAMWW